MDMISTLVIAETVKSAISGIVKTMVIPKIQNLATKTKLEIDSLMIPRGEHFEEYLNRVYKKHSVLNTIVRSNTQMRLLDIYVPMSLSCESEKSVCKITGYPNELMKKYNKILITDTAGMGKSTMTKRMFLDVIENGYGIPIYIELRRLSKQKTILSELVEQINSLGKNFDKDLLYKFFAEGGFVFFLDGYDEISLEDKDSVTDDIQTFINKVSEDNAFILTSRPEPELTCFGAFLKYKINPLTKKEAYELLRKYDSKGETSKLLISQLKTTDYSMIEEFLQNPLLVSLLFTAFDYKQTIPLKKHIFYRQVFDAYFDSHDLSKGSGFTHQKKTKLSIDDFYKVLRCLGFYCLKESKVEFSKDQILELIRKSKSLCPTISFAESDLLDDLLTAVPFFVHDGIFYKWTHKSLQEFFAAQYIYLDAQSAKENILAKLIQSQKRESFANLLDLYSDIDSEGFRQFVVLPIFGGYINYYDEVSKTEQYQTLVKDNFPVEERIFALYNRNLFLYVSSLVDKQLGTFWEGPAFRAYQEYTKGNSFSFAVTNYKKGYTPILIEQCSESFLWSIIQKHSPRLFRYIEDCEVDDGSKELANIQRDSLHKLDITFGDSSIEQYSAINRFCYSHYLMSIPIVENLKQECENIKQFINQIANADILSGL